MPVLRITINIQEIAAQAGALRSASDRLKEVGKSYKKAMDTMVRDWQGSSGRSFAEAAGRVQAGYTINSSVVEQLIYDVTRASRGMVEADRMRSRRVATMSAE